MARLKPSDRANLPDRAFAYVDSRGRRRLPIHDEAHVRNALARFARVSFEDESARELARKRLLTAAKKYGIVPVGFITGQLRAERRHAGAGTDAADPATLPTGLVTFLLTDIEGSTGLLRLLGDRYASLLTGVRDVVRNAVRRGDGRLVDIRADECFAVFEHAVSAIEAALALQRDLGAMSWPDDLECRVRAGIHSGRPTLTDAGYIGLSVHTAARICSAAHGGQVLVSQQSRTATRGASLPGVRFRSLGRHRLQGLTRAELLFQVEADGLIADFPPLRTASAPPSESGRWPAPAPRHLGAR